MGGITRSTLAAAFVLTVGLCDFVPSNARPVSIGPPAPPALKVIYPKPGQGIGPVDSTFVIGSVTPGSVLHINGQTVDVYRTGGFLAWLPVERGEFTFHLRATNGEQSDSLDLSVSIADPRPIPADSGTIIREGSIRPAWNQTIRSGDEIEVSFDGTVGCQARFWIVGSIDSLGPVPMTEIRRQHYSDFQTYRRDALLENGRGEGELPARGRYTGIWKVPEIIGGDSLEIHVELTGPPPEWIDQRLRRNARLHGPPTPVDTVQHTVRMTAPGALRPVDDLPPRVVELTDSVQILRMGPRLGYLTIFQPYGVRTRWWGEAGPWTILELAPGLTAWIETDKTRLLPEGARIPDSYIARMYTEAGEKSVQFRVGTSQRLPFKVTVDQDLRHLKLILFGATSNTDWIEQDPKDDLIRNIRWSQTQRGVYEVDLLLAQPLWGYDAFYDDRQFVLQIERPPDVGHNLEGLTVAVDAGHSEDPGAIGPTGLKEKDANLEIAWKVHAELKKRGARVVMTRLGDEHMPLYDRPSIAVGQHVDLFVSVHNNAVPDGVNPYYKNGTSTYYYHTFSHEFAWHVQKNVLQATRLDNHGLTQGNFAVIRPTQYPSVLVECAFIILPEQEELLMDEDFTGRTAKGIVKGIEEFVKARLRQ